LKEVCRVLYSFFEDETSRQHAAEPEMRSPRCHSRRPTDHLGHTSCQLSCTHSRRLRCIC